MFKKQWVFCNHCGKSYRTTDLKVQFCSKKCMNSWINCESDTHLGQSRNFGQVDKSKYNKWRRFVYNKYNGKCQTCNTIDRKMHAHHVVKWSDSESLRYDVLNGLLLCENCHSLVHGYSIGTGTKILKNKKEMKKIREKYIKVAGIKHRMK